MRRSVLETLDDGDASSAVTGMHLARALDDLLDTAQAVTRALLGVGVDPADLPSGPMPTAAPPGWLGRPGRRSAWYYDSR